MDFGGKQLHALCSEHSTTEGNLRPINLALQAVEDNTMLFGCLHQLELVLVMLLWSMAIYPYIVMNGNYAWETVLWPGAFASERRLGKSSV